MSEASSISILRLHQRLFHPWKEVHSIAGTESLFKYEGWFDHKLLNVAVGGDESCVPYTHTQE
jgi:hypothetical protein